MKAGTREDRRSLPLRLLALQWAVGLIFACLAGAFWYLQIIQHEHYKELAQNNHQRTLALRAPRGMLFDRHGRSARREPLRVQHLARPRAGARPRRDTGAGRADHRDRRGISARDRQAPRARAELSADPPRVRCRHGAGVGGAGAAPGTAGRPGRAGADAAVSRQRAWPPTCSATWAKSPTCSCRAPRTPGCRSGDVVGQAGVELTYNRLLMGEDGARRVVVNSAGREIQTLGELAPVEGRRLQLTIDYDLQRAAEEGFKALGFWGAAVVLDPRNGEVLSLVSLPAYDPNSSPVAWIAPRGRRSTPMRSARCRTAPSRAGIRRGPPSRSSSPRQVSQEGVITPDFKVFCPGRRRRSTGAASSATWRAATARWTCATRSRSRATPTSTRSATCWASIASTSGPRPSASPIAPASTCRTKSSRSCRRRAWKRAKTGEKWYAGETISVAIGQGQVSVTPDFDGHDDVDGGQRRHAARAAPGEGRRRRDRLDAGASAERPGRSPR